MSKRKFVMSDIHGHFRAARELLKYANVDLEKGDSLRFLGDYIDRGPDSYACLRLVQEWHKKGAKVHMGNHEAMFLMWCAGQLTDELYFANGGKATLDSFERADIRNEDLDEILQFIGNDLILQHQDEDFVYVHAGINPFVQLSQQTVDDAIWTRDEFLQADPMLILNITGGKVVVHGHTPEDAVTHHGHRICTDIGAGGRNKLALLELNEMKVYTYNFEAAKQLGSDYTIKESYIR